MDCFAEFVIGRIRASPLARGYGSLELNILGCLKFE